MGRCSRRKLFCPKRLDEAQKRGQEDHPQSAGTEPTQIRTNQENKRPTQSHCCRGSTLKVISEALILLMILKGPGEVVLREEIRQKLWPLDTVVEFDHSINAAIQKLRDALGESADNPRYIETLPRRGHRFIGTVERPPGELVIEEALIEPVSVKMAPRKWSPVVFAAVIVILTLLALAGWLRPWKAPAPVRNVTASLGAIGESRVSLDGTAVLYRDSRGLFLRRLDSLEETPVYTHEGLNDEPLWSPDGLQTVFVTSKGGSFAFPCPTARLLCSGQKFLSHGGLPWRRTAPSWQQSVREPPKEDVFSWCRRKGELPHVWRSPG
jgi:hypothetical protein